MLLPLLIAASHTLVGDTVPVHDVVLLGEPVGVAACVAAVFSVAEVVSETASAAEGASVARYASPAELKRFGDVVLLGEPIGVPTYVAEAPVLAKDASASGYIPFSVYASMPLPVPSSPGLPEHRVDAASDVGFTRTDLDRAILSVEQEVYRGGIPGAALAIGRWNRTVVERGIGTLDRSTASPAVDPDNAIYDLASLTKVIATTTAVMLLVEDGTLELDAPVARYLPAFSGGDKDLVTIRQLLSHNSGLPAGAATSGPNPQASLARAISTPLRNRPGAGVEYSDIGFIVLFAAAEAAHGAPLSELLEKRVFGPLGMTVTNYRPGAACVRCAPTDERPGYRGVVHDPIARQLGGVAGHAGLFSTAHDLSIFAAMMVNGGELNGVRVLDPATLEMFTQRQPGAGNRALGWEKPAANGSGAGGLRISARGFGHTGFTGTSLWIDPERGTWVVLLSNRTLNPVGNRIQQLRREINDRVATAVDLSE